MYWSEKVDLIKKTYPAPAFRDMFRQGGNVIEKIIRRFHHASYLTFTQSDNPKVLLKSSQFINEIASPQLESYLEQRLETNQNYWLFLLNTPMGKPFQVYDCQQKPLINLYYSAYPMHQRFYIVDKKYRWLLFFEQQSKTDTICIYESKQEL